MSHDWSKIKRIASLEIGLVSIFLFFIFACYHPLFMYMMHLTNITFIL